MIPLERPPKAAADRANRNGGEGSDKLNARVGRDNALENVMAEPVANPSELFEQFSDNPGFDPWLWNSVFCVTYAGTAAQGLQGRIVP